MHFVRSSLAKNQTSVVSCVSSGAFRSRCGAPLPSQRWYRGGANDADPKPPSSPLEEALRASAQPKAEAIFRKHVAFPDPTTIPSASWGLRNANANEATTAPTDVCMDSVRRKRLVYRSKQRGWLEVDLLLGTWASDHVHTLSESDLNDYETFVNWETVDIYNVVTLRTDVPDALKTPVVAQIQDWVRNSPLGRADPAAYERTKARANLI